MLSSKGLLRGVRLVWVRVGCCSASGSTQDSFCFAFFGLRKHHKPQICSDPASRLLMYLLIQCKLHEPSADSPNPPCQIKPKEALTT